MKITEDSYNFASLIGKSGGQVLYGGIGEGDNLTLQSTSNATKGKIFLGANSVYDEVNERLGINQTTPTATGHFKGLTSDNTAYALKIDDISDNPIIYAQNDGRVTIGSNATIPSWAALQIYNKGALSVENNSTSSVVIKSFSSTATWTAPIISCYRGRGTQAAPSAVNSDDYLLRLRTYGYGESGFENNGSAEISFLATENHSDVSHGTEIRFLTTENGAENFADRMKIAHNGNIGVGQSTPTAMVHIKGSTSDNTTYSLKVDDSSDSNLFSVRNDGLINFSGDLVFTTSGSGLPYGGIYASNNTTNTTLNSASKSQILIFDTNGTNNLMTPDHTNDHITITTAGVYQLSLYSSVSNQAGSAHKISVSVWKNNGATELTNTRVHRTLASGDDTGSIGITAHVILEVGDTIEVWSNTDRALDSDVLFEDINMNLTMIGG